MKQQLTLLLLLLPMAVAAQKIDFNQPNRPENEGLEPGFTPWVVAETTRATATFDEGVTITLHCDPAYAGQTVMSKYWKQGVTNYGAKLVGDGVVTHWNDHANITEGAVKLDVTISGLSTGRHSLQAYHNNVDGFDAPPIDVYVDGTRVLQGVEQTNRAVKAAESGQSYVEFDVAEGATVTVSYVTVPAPGIAYGSTAVTINALVFDQTNSSTAAASPWPQNSDEHADADSGTLTLSWKAAPQAVSHNIYIGTREDDLSLLASTADTCFAATGLTPAHTYYWRVDEVDADGQTATGEVWSFRPRRLAFPDAEGYGRFAIGGRDGVVYHVTSLADDPASPQPGTLRYGIAQLSGPRTIVFDVAGTITLKARLTCTDKYVTLAGQTAPGRGIMLRGAPLGMQSDGITRFIRMRLGYHNGETDKGLDGMGMAGNDHAIMDHCSIAWTIDEGFSSRNAKHITLQRTLISEALNIADHPNYDSGKAHGFAATIGGGQQGAEGATFHHNLLAHNEGRNWSLSGGLDGDGYYDGHHDIFNNVVYNWGGRATDGGTHQGQFVANYYKMGPATTQTFLLNAQLEGTGRGSQAYYVHGNLRENTDGTRTTDKLNDTYKYTLSGGQKLDWTVFVGEPFFPSHATVQTAMAAYRNVLSDVGCNQPALDNHDERMVSETLLGTTSTVGSISHKKGLIDRETDAEGFSGLNIVEATRPSDWDTDQDGMPDWFEQLAATNPLAPDHNLYRPDGYTHLEYYLEFLAHPHYAVRPDTLLTIRLQPLFAGFTDLEILDDHEDTDDGVSYYFTPDGQLCYVSMFEGLRQVSVTVRQRGTNITMTRRLNIAVTSHANALAAAVQAPATLHTSPSTSSAAYNLGGRQVGAHQGGLVVRKGKKEMR